MEKKYETNKDLLSIIQKSFSKYHPLADQIIKSFISIPSNIAEGCERGSDADFARFLYISRGSCAELITQLTIIELSGKNKPWLVFIDNWTKRDKRNVEGTHK